MPFILTFYVIVPFGTLLTPSRVVPLVLLAWMVISARGEPFRRHLDVFLVVITLSIVSVLAALMIADSGSRPLLRFLNYATLLSIFAFAAYGCRTPKGLTMAMWGLAICAGLHGAYALYQIVAFETGLPFRAIVRGLSGRFDVAQAYGLFRVNGLASEPKRLGYVLFAGALASIYLTKSVSPGLHRTALRTNAIISFALSFLTMSASYFAAVAVSIGGMLLMSSRLWRIVPVGVAVVGLALFASPDLASRVTDLFADTVEDRFEEVSAGLDAVRVYRQEFYAEDYAKAHPLSLVTGLGMGRYNNVLNEEYGEGVGLVGNMLLPLNSQIFEIGFDLGLPGLLILYGGSVALILSLKTDRKLSFFLKFLVLCVVAQSVFVQSLYLGSFILGMAVAYANMPRGAWAPPDPMGRTVMPRKLTI
ncbi:MAG: hypothetical protein GC160_24025 [Acidobacteria bacterium]|nr:hypothetical protein [Acidobacteriota bacterium]